jgi:hypothetical protein
MVEFPDPGVWLLPARLNRGHRCGHGRVVLIAKVVVAGGRGEA